MRLARTAQSHCRWFHKGCPSTIRFGKTQRTADANFKENYQKPSLEDLSELSERIGDYGEESEPRSHDCIGV